MKTRQHRYGFWKVFWVVLAAYTFFGIIGLIALNLVPSEANKAFKMFSLMTVIKLAFSFTFTTLFFFITVNFYYRLMVQKTKFLPYLRFSLFAILACVIYHVCSYFVFPIDQQEKLSPVPLFIFGVLINTLFVVGLSLLIAYLTMLRDNQKMNKVLEEQKMQLEVEKSQANLNFLKAQINPHFLHNTLNFLYAKSLPYSSELSEGILTLSDIMRYALSEGNAKNGKAPLKDEIEHVRNVIKINQLRFSNNLNVQFSVNGVVNGATIIPFVLITLVENAFKHGDLKNPGQPIDIRLDVNGESMKFFCRNKKKTGPKEISTGVGLDNIRKRLELAYGNNFEMCVEDEESFYTTQLIIKNL